MRPRCIAQPMYANTELSSGGPVESSIRSGTRAALMTAITAVTAIEILAGSPVVVEDDFGNNLLATVPDVRIVSAGLFSTSDIISYKRFRRWYCCETAEIVARKQSHR